MEINRKVVIYQMMTRLFGNKVTANKWYGTIVENGVGKFDDINLAALEGIRALGATHVWYTGIIEHALLTDYTEYGIPLDDADVVKGRAGSPYAIKDYYDVDPDLAVNIPDRMREFEQLVERTHKQDLKVIIDFVPNHVARVYHSDAKPKGSKDFGEDDDTSVAFHPHNNFYYLPGEAFQPPADYTPLGPFTHPTKDGKFEEFPAKATGNDAFIASPGVDSWFETVKLNYGVDIQNNRRTHFDPVPDTWLKMHDILLFWVGKNVDGFRCDMAEMVPVEFWQWVIPRIKEVRQDIVFIAEIYNRALYRKYLQTGKFDFLYDKVLLYDTLRQLVGGHGSTLSIHAIQRDHEGISQHMLNFLENHDEQRIASEYFAGGPWRALPAFVISAAIDRGPVMIYFGQEVGEPAIGRAGFQNDDGRTTIFDYWGVPEHQKWMNEGAFDGARLSNEQKKLRSFYSHLLTFVSRNTAIAKGRYIDLTTFNIKEENFSHRVHAFLRSHESECLLILNSFNDKDEDVKVQIPEEAFSQTGLDQNHVLVGRDLIRGKVEVEFDKALAFSLTLAPYCCFIFKVEMDASSTSSDMKALP